MSVKRFSIRQEFFDFFDWLLLGRLSNRRNLRARKDHPTYDDCQHFGNCQQVDWVCAVCVRAPICSKVTDIKCASLNELPKYIVAHHPEVREAAKARFIELQEGK